ncbi:metal ABC transporter substrate-binding protein [Demequina sp.]|uniref:metal ABC transporter substrate-binding protein n=1 Tax=Demequina sp. TaxID=2050685 RepID=UPI0025BB7EF7|nr:metal ABC transporter substrate-binding protein [Demequina sp.]
MKTTSPLTLTVSAVSALALAACSTSGTSTDSPAGGDAPTLTVATAFYPLQFVAEAVGGDHVAATSLTPPGVEPHGVELSPATVRELSNTDLVLFIDEFQPAVEDAIEATGVTALDAAEVIALDSAEEHADEEDDHGSTDPHFWLDPALLADYAIAVGDRFASLDPTNAADYAANASALADELRDLDEQFTAGLATCEHRVIITAHEAFGYLAHAYDLEQVGIAGVEPDTEPSPARLREIHGIIAETGATTVFTEELVSPKVAEALAQDSGVVTAVLDPIASVGDGDDYRGVMLRNLDALRTALACE